MATIFERTAAAAKNENIVYCLNSVLNESKKAFKEKIKLPLKVRKMLGKGVGEVSLTHENCEL